MQHSHVAHRAASGSRPSESAPRSSCVSSRGCSSRPLSTPAPCSPWLLPKAQQDMVPSLARTRRGVAKPSWLARAVVDDPEDLLQHPDRIKWYESKFCADDMPDWNVGRFISSEDMAPGIRHVVLECEISRERVPLRNAYKTVGQKASIRVNNGVEYHLTASTAPFSMSLNREALFRVRGDLFAYEVKTAKEPLTTMGELHLMVSREEAPEIFNMQPDDNVEVGPFRGSGLDLRGSGILAIYSYPTLVMFVSGHGIAHARALLTASSDVPNLSPTMRKDIRVYYKVPNEASACFSKQLSELEKQLKPCGYRFIQTTSTFGEAFDDDDTLVYEPETTAALILTGGDAEAEAAALEVCKEAEISTILRDSMEQAAPVYLASVPPSFMRWKKDKEEDGDVAEIGETKSNVVPLQKPAGRGKR